MRNASSKLHHRHNLICCLLPLLPPSTLQVLELLQADVAMRQAAAAAGPLPAGSSGAGGSGGAGPSCSSSAAAAAAVPMAVELEGSKAAFADQLTAEVEDLKAEMVVAHRDKKVLEEQYLAQIIAVSWLFALNWLDVCFICCDDDVL
jgi:hypothetical protein